MNTVLMILLAVVTALVCIVSILFCLSARKAARAAVIDTMRIDGIIEHDFTICPDADGWGVLQNGGLVAMGKNLRDVLDEADNKVADHG